MRWLITGEGKMWADGPDDEKAETGPYQDSDDMARRLLYLLERRVKELEREIKCIGPE